MSFLPELKMFLGKRGFIYTVRKYEMYTGAVEIEGVGTCWRTLVGLAPDQDYLKPYVRHSGFDSLEAWEEKIRFFIPDKATKRYLYKVEVLDERETSRVLPVSD